MIPQGWTEENFLREMERIINLLAGSFKFPGRDIEDIKQEARLAVLKDIHKYSVDKGSIQGFLYTLIKSRLYNLRRNGYFSGDCPCRQCKGRNNGTTKHKDGMYCKKYKEWLAKNTRKQNVVSPYDIKSVDDEVESAVWFTENLSDNIILEELKEKIDRELPIEMRSTYLKMIDNAGGISKIRRLEVINKIKEILGVS